MNDDDFLNGIEEDIFIEFTFEDYFDEDGVQDVALRTDIARFCYNKIKQARSQLAEEILKAHIEYFNVPEWIKIAKKAIEEEKK